VETSDYIALLESPLGNELYESKEDAILDLIDAQINENPIYAQVYQELFDKILNFICEMLINIFQDEVIPA